MTVDKAKVSAGNLPKPATNLVHSLRRCSVACWHASRQPAKYQSFALRSVRPISHRRASKGDASHSPAFGRYVTIEYVSVSARLSGLVGYRYHPTVRL